LCDIVRVNPADGGPISVNLEHEPHGGLVLHFKHVLLLVLRLKLRVRLRLARNPTRWLNLERRMDIAG
jgi:hypothetical protein